MSISAQQDVYASLGLSTPANAARGTNDASDLGLNSFLKLMVTQLNNQDPFKPMDNGQFLGQIAQFASVTGLEELNGNFDSLAATITSGQALQAGSLVGREVLAPVEAARLEAGGVVRGQVAAAEAGSDVTLRVYDHLNQLVREMPLGRAEEGQPLTFTWDGNNDSDEFAGEGIYRLRLQTELEEGPVDLQTRLFSRVESVNLDGARGLTVNLEGLGPVAFNHIQQITDTSVYD
jgi:flagellar basal-body rod modification protein FlgD